MSNLHFKKFNKDVHCIDEDFDKYVQVKLCLARLLSEDWTVCAGAVKMRSDEELLGVWQMMKMTTISSRMVE